MDFALRKRLGTFHLDVAHTAATRRLAIVGPSGSGKTLILRLVAGLDVPDDGTVHFEGIPLHSLPAEARRLGYVPQEYGLFPHLTVWQQLIFGVGADYGTARYWLGRLELDGLEDRLPAQLSMGQRQRVALGRALVRRPRLLLLDEPFSALDVPVREAVRRDMRALQHETEMATLLVTHDPSEAAFLADEVVVLAEGRVLQTGSVGTVFGHPGSARIARLLGIPNVHGGRIVAPGLIEAPPMRLTVAIGARQLGQRVTWCVRPEDIQVGPDGPLVALVRDVIDLGGTREVLVAVDSHLELRLRTTAEINAGSTCRLTIPPDAVTVWADDTDT
jgi:molybdate transport system permease protein